MKKRIITLLLVTITLFSCDVTKELSGAYNMINCQYSYKSISGLTVSGMNLSNGVSPLYIPKLTSILTGSATSIPVDFTLNLNVKNPNQSEALLHGLQYIVSIDDIKFTSGTLNKSLNIPSGETQTLPLTIGIDLASLMKNNSKEAITDIAKNFIGIGSKKSNVTVQVKPTFLIGNTPITSPTYIPVNFKFLEEIKNNTAMEYEVIHNREENRFEIHIGNQIALVDYIKGAKECLNIMHTEVPKNLEGQGIAAKLTKAILDYARSNGFKVRPVCPYTKAYIEKHTEYLDIVAK